MICCDKCITVFSFNGRTYERYFYEGVSVFGFDGVSITNSGFEESNGFKIRIPTEEALPVKPGDRIVFGNADALEPQNAYTVTEVYDNRRGSSRLWHYLVKAL